MILDFIINTVLDAEGRIYRVVAGDYRQAHRQGVKYARKSTTDPFGKRLMWLWSVPILWTSISAVQKDTPETMPQRRQGGTIILVSPNYEGVGPHPEYGGLHRQRFR